MKKIYVVPEVEIILSDGAELLTSTYYAETHGSLGFHGSDEEWQNEGVSDGIFEDNNFTWIEDDMVGLSSR